MEDLRFGILLISSASSLGLQGGLDDLLKSIIFQECIGSRVSKGGQRPPHGMETNSVNLLMRTPCGRSHALEVEQRLNCLTGHALWTEFNYLILRGFVAVKAT
jgi:hypothetical protein